MRDEYDKDPPLFPYVGRDKPGADYPLIPFPSMAHFQTPTMITAQRELEAKVDTIVDGMRTGTRIVLPFTKEDLQALEAYNGPPPAIVADLVSRQLAHQSELRARELASLIMKSGTMDNVAAQASLSPEAIMGALEEAMRNVKPAGTYPVAVCFNGPAYARILADRQRYPESVGHTQPGFFTTWRGMPFGVVNGQAEPVKAFWSLEAFREYLREQENGN